MVVVLVLFEELMSSVRVLFEDVSFFVLFFWLLFVKLDL